jgi:amidase
MAYRVLAILSLLSMFAVPASHAQNSESRNAPFQIMETTTDEVHAAYQSGKLTAHQLVQAYLDRIEAFDKHGPAIKCIITLNPKALEDADKLDEQYKRSGFVGPLHGIPDRKSVV